MPRTNGGGSFKMATMERAATGQAVAQIGSEQSSGKNWMLTNESNVFVMPAPHSQS
jgi:hypothetical protein